MLGWEGVVKGKIEMAEIPFEPAGSLSGENTRIVAEVLKARLGRG